MDAGSTVPFSTMASKRAVAPCRAERAVDSYSDTTACAASAASLAVSAAAPATPAFSLAVVAALLALLAALVAVVAALFAFVAAALAVAAASVAGLPSKDTGSLTSSEPRSAGRLLILSSEVTSVSSFTPWLSALIAFRMSFFNSVFSASVSAMVYSSFLSLMPNCS